MRENHRLFGSVTEHFGDWTTELAASEIALLSLNYWVLQTFIYFQKGCVFLVTEGELRVKPSNSSGLPTVLDPQYRKLRYENEISEGKGPKQAW